MPKTLCPKLILILIILTLQTTMVAQSSPLAIEWIPQNAVISLELSNSKALLDLFAGEKAIEFITSLPMYQKQMSNPKFREFLGIVRYLEGMLGTDWRTALKKLTGGGVTFAICPRETVIFIIESEDEQMLNKLHEIFLNIARDEARKEGQPERVASKKHRDITAWTSKDNIGATYIIYPQWIESSQGDLYIFYLTSTTDVWRQHYAYRVSTDGGNSWGPEHRILSIDVANGGGSDSWTIYASIAYDATKEKLHIGLTIYDPNPVTFTDVYHCYMAMASTDGRTKGNMYDQSDNDLGPLINYTELDSNCRVVSCDTVAVSTRVDTDGNPHLWYSESGSSYVPKHAYYDNG